MVDSGKTRVLKMFIAALVATAAASGCSRKSETEPQPAPEPEEASLYFVLGDGSHSSSCSAEFTAAGGSQALTLHSSAAWTASCDADWLEAPASGEAGDVSFGMAAEANPDMESRRMATVEVVSGGLSCTVSVLQGELPGFVVETTEFEIGSAGCTIEVPVRANIEYRCAVEADGEGWIGVQATKSLVGHAVTLSIAENPEPDARVGHVTVSYEGQSATLTVTQSQLDELILTETSFEIGSDGGEIRVPVSTNVEYAAEVLGDAASWLSVGELRTKGLEDFTLVLNASANGGYDGRVGQVRVSGAGKESVLTVTQLGIEYVEPEPEDPYYVESVDLGLSVLWAKCNIGASSPLEYGDYYAWGETSTKDVYSLETYDPLGDGAGVYDALGSDISGTQYDVARLYLGGAWRIPTKEDVNELIDNTVSEPTSIFNVYTGFYVSGVSFTSTVEGFSDQSIFLPVGDDGHYWTSTTTGIYVCSFYPGSGDGVWESYPYEGLHIRPVCDK